EARQPAEPELSAEARERARVETDVEARIAPGSLATLERRLVVPAEPHAELGSERQVDAAADWDEEEGADGGRGDELAVPVPLRETGRAKDVDGQLGVQRTVVTQ